MLKMIIADDEEIERKSLRMMIEKNVPEIHIVGEAENGRKAVELAEALRPDLITMDIKMPGISGIEAVELLNAHYPDIRFIMVSAFDEFEYARQVMKYGVKEFLVKPCKIESIIQSVKNTIEDIHDYKQMNDRLELLHVQSMENNTLMEGELVSHILIDQTPRADLNQMRRHLDTAMIDGGFTIVFFLDGEGAVGDSSSRREQYLWLRQLLKESITCFVGPMVGPYMAAFIIPPSLNDERQSSTRSYALQISRMIVNRFERTFKGKRLRIGAGRMYRKSHDLAQSYHEALIGLQFRENAIISLYEDIGMFPPAGEQSSLSEAPQQILRALKQGDKREAHEKFDCYFEQVMVMANGRRELVNYDMNKLLSLLIQSITDRRVILNPNMSSELSGDVHHLKRQMKYRLDILMQDISKWYSEEQKGKLLKAKQYIDEHYFEELSLDEVAAHIQLNPFYFSKLFHDRMGITFVDYITQLRIAMAKELLHNPKHSLKSISLQIGYRDPNYFSRVFRKCVGQSPGEYRTSMQRPKAER